MEPLRSQIDRLTKTNTDLAATVIRSWLYNMLHECVCICVCVCVCMCVRVCVRVRVRENVHVHVPVCVCVCPFCNTSGKSSCVDLR